MNLDEIVREIEAPAPVEVPKEVPVETPERRKSKLAINVKAGLIDDSWEEPKKEIPTEIVATPIEAWRMWRVVRPQELRLTPDVLKALSKKYMDGQNPFEGLLGAKLSGVGNSVPWEAATHDARCTAGATSASHSYSIRAQMLYGGPGSITNNHAVPHQTCTCGVWALNSEEMLWKTILQYDANQNTSFAYGKVQLWGRIIEHKLGYRAAHARPTELHLVRSDQDTADELAAFYGCPCDLVEMPEQATKMRSQPDEYGTSPGSIWITSPHNYTQIFRSFSGSTGGMGQYVTTNVNNTGAPLTQASLDLAIQQANAGMTASKVAWLEDEKLPLLGKKLKDQHELEQAKIQKAKRAWRKQK